MPPWKPPTAAALAAAALAGAAAGYAYAHEPARNNPANATHAILYVDGNVAGWE